MMKFIHNYKILSLKAKDGNQKEYYDYLDSCDKMMLPPKASGILRNRVLDRNIDLQGYQLGD